MIFWCVVKQYMILIKTFNEIYSKNNQKFLKFFYTKFSYVILGVYYFWNFQHSMILPKLFLNYNSLFSLNNLSIFKLQKLWVYKIMSKLFVVLSFRIKINFWKHWTVEIETFYFNRKAQFSLVSLFQKHLKIDFDFV